ncbi:MULTISPECIES: gliding motility-associated C-terminal domain-containing protein [Chitinophagaceae]
MPVDFTYPKNARYRNYLTKIVFFWTVLFAPFWIHAQLLSPNQPEQDACDAIELCGNTFTSTYSYQGVGARLDLPNSPCGSGEANSVWLKVTIKTAGKLAFLIKPIEIHDDYDFAVIKSDGDCSQLAYSQVVRCNFNNNMEGSNVNGIVGLSTDSDEPYVQSGASQHSFSQAIDANAGDVYYVMINNFGYASSGGPSAGFTIDFSTSTATFANTTIPLLDKLVAACDYSQSATIHLSNYALCGSVAADGSDFTLMSADKTQTFPILSASGVNCSGAAGYARDITVQFSNHLQNGDYILQVKKGSDGNSISGLCGGETPENTNPITFSVKMDSLKLVSIDSPACQQMRLVFDKTIQCSAIKKDGAQFYITGPANVKVVAAQASASCTDNYTTGILLLLDRPMDVDGPYTLHTVEDESLYGSCDSKLYKDVNYTFHVQSFNSLLKTLADTTVCALGDSIQLVTQNYSLPPVGGFQYKWTLDDNSIPNSNQSSPWVKIADNENHFQIETVDARGCVLRDTTSVRVETFTGSLSPTSASICQNDSLQLAASDNAIAYQWFQNPTLTTRATATFSATDIINPLYKPDAIGTFDYYLLMRSSKQCLDTLVAHIEVKPLPDLQLAFRDTTINYGTDIQLLTSGNSIQYQWTPTISLYNSVVANPLAHPLVNTTYLVYSIGANGCHISDSLHVNIFFQDYAYFPTAFTPNQDGKNDLFRARFFGKIQHFVLNIYNRWGQKMYSSNDPESGWDGRVNNDVAPPGTYIWECTYQPDGHQLYDKKGTVVLIR